MQRRRGGLLPLEGALADLSDSVKALRDASPQPHHYFTRSDWMNPLADADTGSMARMMLCSLPRGNPANQKEYIRCNDPYTL